MSMGNLQIFLTVSALLFLGVVFWMLKKKKLSLRYSLLWLAGALAALVMACCPYLIKVLRAYTGVEVVAHLVFFLVCVFMMLVLLHLTAAVSDAAERLKRLTQAGALLEERLRRLEGALPPDEAPAPAHKEGTVGEIPKTAAGADAPAPAQEGGAPGAPAVDGGQPAGGRPQA